MRKGHTSEEADRICGALEQKAAGSELVTSLDSVEQNESSNNLSQEEAPKENVSFSGSEINDITQGLTDAKAFLATVEAPPELIDSINKAFDVVYSKVDAGPAEGEGQAPPF